MIVSCSRRTDVPALYGPWLRSRLSEGWAEVAHPYDRRRVRRVDLKPSPRGDLEALILWTRDPGPLLASVPEWEGRGLRTLWLVTLTAYPSTLEPGAPDAAAALESLRRLASLVGPHRVVWRYDPVLSCPSADLGEEWHLGNFRRLAASLAGAATRCVVSLYDDYARARRRLGAAGLAAEAPRAPLLGRFGEIARGEGIEVRSCCEDAEEAGIRPGACIDGEVLAQLWGIAHRGRDPGQRGGCRCAPSVDIGAYDTCVHGCLYCYATSSAAAAARRRAAHDPAAGRLDAVRPAEGPNPEGPWTPGCSPAT